VSVSSHESSTAAPGQSEVAAVDAAEESGRRLSFRKQAFRRTLRAIVVAFWVMVVAFGLIRLAPGDPVVAALGADATPEAIAVLRADLGLNVDVFTQFFQYTTALLRGDLGQSMFSGVSVTTMLSTNLPVTLWLIGLTILLTILLSVPIAMFVALVRWKWLPYAFRSITAVGLALPSFLVALIFLLYFGIRLGIAPISGYDAQFPQNLGYLWLPALVNCVILVPILSRVLYSSLSDTLEEEFVETGIIRGVNSFRFLWLYVLRPSLAPTIVLLSYMMGVMIGSTVILEIIFSLPGIGRELVSAVTMRDYPVVQSIVLVFGVLVVILSLLGDLLATLLDPRVKMS